VESECGGGGMIGVFDSGIGGLTVLKALAARFPQARFLYLADQAHTPYGNRPAEEIFELTRAGISHLFDAGCRLVLLGCNTATAVAARRLQSEWLPVSRWRAGHNVLGIIAPTVEAATQTPWAVTTPQYPQKYNTDVVAVFGTRRTIASDVYLVEIAKRCPKVRVLQQACPDLAGAIEQGADEAILNGLVANGVARLMTLTDGATPHRAILGCTHYPIVEHLFRQHLPASTRILSQPEIVANSLEDYLARHPRYLETTAEPWPSVILRTTGDPARVAPAARIFWPDAPGFEVA